MSLSKLSRTQTEDHCVPAVFLPKLLNPLTIPRLVCGAKRCIDELRVRAAPENDCFNIYNAKATGPGLSNSPTPFSTTFANSTPLYATVGGADGPQPPVPGALGPSDKPITDQAKELTVYI
jgi:hypothetical protein